MIVREAISFTRNIDPKEGMAIGKAALFTEMMEDLAHDHSWALKSEAPKSLNDFTEKKIHHIDTRKIASFYSMNQNRPAMMQVFNELLDKIKTFNPNNLENYASGWVQAFYLLGREDDLWNAPKSWITEYTFNDFMRYEPQRTIDGIKKLGPNKAFSLSYSHWTPELLLWAIENGATNLNIDSDGPIQKACERGDLDVAKALLSSPIVDPAAQTRDGKRYGNDETNYCIRRAAKNGYVDIVKLLLKDKRVDPTSRDNWALAAALNNGDREMVSLLLSDPRVKKEVPYMKELSKKRLRKMMENNLVRESLGFTRGGDAKANIGIGREKLLGDFIEEVNNEIAKYPSLKNFPLKMEDKNGILTRAAMKGNVDIVRLLLSDPAANPAFRKNSIIASAAMGGNPDVIELLLKDERVNPADNHNEALYQAAKNNNIDAVKKLMEDPRVNPADAKESLDKNYNIVYEDNYIIYEAAANQAFAVVEELLKDPRVKVKKTLQMLVSKISKVGTSEKAKENWLKMIEIILSKPKIHEELSDKEIDKIKAKINKI